MTAQINDVFLYSSDSNKCSNYALVGITGNEILEISSLGLYPVPVSTASWSGHRKYYSIIDSQLVLSGLDINLGKSQTKAAPAINGVSATHDADNLLFNSRYEGINLLLTYSGKLLIAVGFIADLYDHMGFHPSWKFKIVHELEFVGDGHLINEIDISDENAALRQRIMLADQYRLGDDATIKDIETYVTNSFSRSFAEL
jgi:hypothetical protein